MAKKLYQHLDRTPMQVSEPAVTYRQERTVDAGVIGLNSAQLHLIQMLSYVKTEETFQDLKKLLREFYIQQVEKEADRYWVEGKISDELLNEHLRTPYK